jgi:hypothetical protein
MTALRDACSIHVPSTKRISTGMAAACCVHKLDKLGSNHQEKGSKAALLTRLYSSAFFEDGN